MRIRDWHPGKVVVIWVMALASYVFFDDVLEMSRSEARSAWFLALVVAAAMTWGWLSGRERQ